MAISVRAAQGHAASPFQAGLQTTQPTTAFSSSKCCSRTSDQLPNITSFGFQAPIDGGSVSFCVDDIQLLSPTMVGKHYLVCSAIGIPKSSRCLLYTSMLVLLRSGSDPSCSCGKETEGLFYPDQSPCLFICPWQLIAGCTAVCYVVKFVSLASCGC